MIFLCFLFWNVLSVELFIGESFASRIFKNWDVHLFCLRDNGLCK